MEKILQAIEKAREARQEARTTHNTSVLAVGAARPAAQKSYSHIDYKVTKRIPTDEITLKNNRVVGGMAHNPHSDPYRMLRSQVLHKLRQNNWKTIGVTSPNRGNGATNIAVNLAVALSQEVNQTVLLVDLDLRDPGVANTFGLQETPKGILDYLEKGTPLSEIMFNPGYPRLVVIPGTLHGPNSSEILSSPAMVELQSELVNRYENRYIIYDLPPILESDDVLACIPQVDSMLLVIEDGGCKKQDIERSLKLINKKPLVGTVINKASSLG